MKKYLPHICVLASGILWGLIGIFNRRLTAAEYLRISHFVRMQDFTGYMQELSSAKEEYIPPFDLSGV